MALKFKELLKYMLIVILFMSAGLILYIFTSYKGDFPEYSTYSTEESGIKALYLLTRRMGFIAERIHYPAMFLDGDYTMVVYRPDRMFLMTSEKEFKRDGFLKLTI